MTDRIIDLSGGPAQLHARNGLLVIERDGEPDVTVPLTEVAALVVAHPRVTFTQSTVSGLADAGGILVTSDNRFLPAAMMLPLRSNFIQTQRLTVQAGASKPTRKRLWQQIICAKICAQAKAIEDRTGTPCSIRKMARRVRSGDPTNVEAQAARRYWSDLFGNEFRRDPDRDDQNRLLNYGYAVLRATVARALCGSGLHPSIGIRHHNRYNPFCLADDIMEPWRPTVDGVVVDWTERHGADAPLDAQAKAALIERITGRFDLDGSSRTLFDVLSRTAASLVAVYAGKEKELTLPEF